MKSVEEMSLLASEALKIPEYIKFGELDNIIELVLDKEGLDSPLDGHGYWENSLDGNFYTVFLCKGFPLVFFLHDDNPFKERWYYTWVCLSAQQWIKNEDIPESQLKMKSRF